MKRGYVLIYYYMHIAPFHSQPSISEMSSHELDNCIFAVIAFLLDDERCETARPPPRPTPL